MRSPVRQSGLVFCRIKRFDGPSSLLPLWEKVARIDRCATDEGSLSTGSLAETDPSPRFAFRETTLSHKGRGWKTYAVIPNSFAAVRPRISAFSSSLSEVEAKMWSTGAICQG
jgi:hypothetical protein